jgi:uncharacterized protein (DUF2147 family)
MNPRMPGAKGRSAIVLSAAFLTAVLSLAPAGAQEGPTPTGVWLHANKRIQIEISPCDDRLCARIIWFQWPNDAEGLPLVDLKNKDPALRHRPLLGLTVLEGLRLTGENVWSDGRIYNPDDGVNYLARMSVETNGSLRIRAYVFLPLFGHTLLWTRVR